VAHPLHEEVRSLFDHRCGYCGVSEYSAGGQLTVDHFRPRSSGGGDDLTNLVYACFRCNLFKSDFYPQLELDFAPEQRILHPLRDDIGRHYLLRENSGWLVPITETGRFHIAVLQLNRPELVAYRLRTREERAKAELLKQLTRERDLQNQIIEYLAAIVAEYEVTGPDED